MVIIAAALNQKPGSSGNAGLSSSVWSRVSQACPDNLDL